MDGPAGASATPAPGPPGPGVRLNPLPWELPLAPAMEALLGIVRRRFVEEEGTEADPSSGHAPGDAPAGAPTHAPNGAPPPSPGLAALAARHGLEGLAHRGGWGDIRAADGVAAGGLLAVAGNLERIRELHRVVGVLEAAGVPTTVMKGPALAVQAWGDVSARSYSDVDLLVPPDRAPATVRALLDAGYTDRRARYGLDPSPAHWHDWGFTAPDGRTLVEIHWSLVAPARYPAVDSAEAWHPASREAVALPGGTVWALAPEIQLPYLAIHATAHHWGWLEFPLTLAGLVHRNRSSLDWDALRDRAHRWRCRRITTVGLLLARDLVGAHRLGLPPEVERWLTADAAAGRLARWYGTQLLTDPDSEWYRGSPALWWRRMRLEDSGPAQLRTGWTLLFGSTTAEWEPPGSSSSRVPAPLRRVLRLLRRHRGDG